MPSPAGVVYIAGSVNLPAHGISLRLALLADARCPASPVPLGYATYEGSRSQPSPPHALLLAGFGIPGDTTQLALRLVGQIFDPLASGAFTLDRKTGALTPSLR